MVTDLQRRLNDARSAAEEAGDATRREEQRVQVVYWKRTPCNTLVICVSVR